MSTLYQYCDTCKTETNFNYETVVCKKCGKKCKNFQENGKKSSI
jgi:hypothetical protein